MADKKQCRVCSTTIKGKFEVVETQRNTKLYICKECSLNKAEKEGNHERNNSR